MTELGLSGQNYFILDHCVAASDNGDNETISGEAAWENASLYYSMPLDKDGVRDCKPYILNSELEVLILPL